MHVLFTTPLLAFLLLLSSFVGPAAVIGAQDVDPHDLLLAPNDIDGEVQPYIDQHSRVGGSMGGDLYVIGYVRAPGSSESGARLIICELMVIDVVPPGGALDGFSKGIELLVGANGMVTPLEGPELGEDSRWVGLQWSLGGEDIEML